ncbi:MAG TPA: AraC family transcriptional regulator [Arachidicoccus sp.]|nr:AraC family transcriptional regulator [Arachidicoccus sp.]
MKAQQLKVATSADRSFSVRRDQVPYVNNRWHYHSEVELIHFRYGEGMQFVGDSMMRFTAGDVVLIGSNLPHYWRFDEVYFDEKAMMDSQTAAGFKADVTVTHFKDNFWGPAFLDLPENTNIKSLLTKAKRGIKVGGVARHKVAQLLSQLTQADGTFRILLLIEALSEIADCGELEALSSLGFDPQVLEADNERVNAVCTYTQNNLHRRILLKEIAEVANISEHAFCRFFKSQTGKTYTQYLIELRVGYACRLLIENRLELRQLCYESGFSNLASFRKYFTMITGKSPANYQQEFTMD